MLLVVCSRVTESENGESSPACMESPSVVVPTSADGLHVLVSGGAVPTLLLTGELGTGPAEVSGKAEEGLRLPLL